MGLFNRKDAPPEPTPAAAAPSPPHPALASWDALTAAPLEQLATAVLLAAFAGRDPGARPLSFEVIQEIERHTGAPIPQINLLVEEALDVLSRSLLIHVDYGSSNARPWLALSRRGVAALASGDPARWMDVPPAPQ